MKTQSRPSHGKRSVRLGTVVVDLTTWEISRGDVRSQIQEKPFRVLEALIEEPGELVTRSELRERLWPDGTIVDFDNNLNSAVASLRTALGDTARDQAIIKTLPRRGYRLLADVKFDEADVTAARRWDARWLAAVVVVGLVAVWMAPGVRSPKSADPWGPSDSVAVPADPQARQAWQRGLYLLERRGVGDRTLALKALEESMRLEPEFAPAQVQIAQTLADMSFAGDLELRQGLRRARNEASHALSLDGDSAIAHRVRALADLHLAWDFRSASKDLESAFRLAPDDAPNYLAAATFLFASAHEEAAIRAARHAVELDPASALLQADLGYFLLAAGRYDEVLELSDELLAVEPNAVHVLGNRLIAAERLGLLEQALSAAQRIMKLGGAEEEEMRALERAEARHGLALFRSWRLSVHEASGDPSLFRLALRQADVKQIDAALATLAKAYERRDPRLIYLHSSASFHELRHDASFQDFARKLGFPEPGDPVVERVEDLIRSIGKGPIGEG